jgi:hypothetical protein
MAVALIRRWPMGQDMDCEISGRAAKLGTILRISSSLGAGARMVIDLPKEPMDE